MASTSMMAANTYQIPYEADIFLDKMIYNPGDSVNGQVTLRLAKKMCCDTVTVKLEGIARVFFIQKSTKPANFGQSVGYEQQITLVDQTQNVWITMNQNIRKALTLDEVVRSSRSTAIKMPNKTENSPGLAQGNHTFNFSFPLPQAGLYTSFDAKDSAGYVRYNILLKVFNGSAPVLRKKLLFAVVVPKVLSNIPMPLKERETTQRKDFDKNSYLSVQLTIDKRVYVPGEPIVGTIFIDNKSGKSVKYALLYIKQETVCYSAQPEIQIHESVSKTNGMGLTVHKIPTGENLTYPIKFNVPALIPNLDVPNCIQTNYHIQLDVGFNRQSPKGAPISIKLPISIGTHLQNPNDRSFPDAPPAYEEIENHKDHNASLYPSFPPDYSESTMGLSTIDSEDGYTPLCYHYNFAFNQEEEEKKNN
ncbi:Arrestin domain-containing protein 5 [Aphelenchoides bicaudatus]|nr:Arrestin domain-containing protein 5 [Aphelenchoides bicaudatus]